MNCKSNIWTSQCKVPSFILDFFLKMSEGHYKFTQVFWACLTKTIKNNHLVKGFHIYQHAKDQLHKSILLWDVAKTLWNCEANCTLSLTSFLKYCKDFGNLFWVIWAGLAMPTKINGIDLMDSLMSSNLTGQEHFEI